MIKIVVPLASWQQVVLYFFKSGGVGQPASSDIGQWPKIRSKRCVEGLRIQYISQLISLNPERLFPVVDLRFGISMTPGL